MAFTTPHRIGILGGTFDPIHLGHLAIAEAARDRLELDRVILIPAGRPWLKSDQMVSAPEHRLAMARLAIENRLGLEMSPIEVDRPGLTYTVDTLTELREELGSGVELYLVLGMDSVRELRRWRYPERLFDLCTVVAVSRPDSTRCLVRRDRAIVHLRRAAGSEWFEAPCWTSAPLTFDCAYLKGRPISDSVPPPVERYIREHGLYLDDGFCH